MTTLFSSLSLLKQALLVSAVLSASLAKLETIVNVA